MALPDGFDLGEFVRRVLAEDLGTGGDVTSRATIAEDARFAAVMNARQQIVVAGLEIAAEFFRAIDPKVQIELLAEDGDRLEAGATLMRLAGNARAMLAAERPALNTLQHLSGIATLTRRYVDAIEGTGAVLIDTRKTIPGLRVLDKYAARMGGAHNHRMRLDDGVLIKDNHVAVCGGRRRSGAAREGCEHRASGPGGSRPPRPDRAGARRGRGPAAARQHGPGTICARRSASWAAGFR